MDEREARRIARQSWPVRLVPEGASDDLRATTTGAERWAMMWPLACEAWALAGLEIPTYTRAEMPITVRRLLY
jgi:hypothetical protein